jgi:hypothetical protein
MRLPFNSWKSIKVWRSSMLLRFGSWETGADPCHLRTVVFTHGGNLMCRLSWLVVLLALAACGGGKSGPTLTVICSGAGGPQLVGATSIDILGDIVNGRPTMNYPDPANSGKPAQSR